jgi:hypothetical protein
MKLKNAVIWMSFYFGKSSVVSASQKSEELRLYNLV